MRLIPDSGTRLREYNKCHEPAGSRIGGRFARSNSGNCSTGTTDRAAAPPTGNVGTSRVGPTSVGITTYRKPEQYMEEPKGTITGQTTYDTGGLLARHLAEIPEVSDVQYNRARGAWSFAGELGREPSFGISYTGNGEARRRLAQAGLQANQDAVLMMYSAEGPLPDGARALPSEVHELAIPGGVSPRVRAEIEATLSKVIPTSGWTWVKRGDAHVLKLARVPQWADETATPEAYAAAVADVQAVMRAAGMQPTYRRQAVRIETLVHERTLDWFPRERGNVTYQDAMTVRNPSGVPDVMVKDIGGGKFQILDRQRDRPIRFKGPKGMRDTFTKREAERMVKVWSKRRAKDVDSFYKGNPGREEWEDLLGWMHGVVGG